MSRYRKNHMTVVVGFKGSGKTTLIREIIRKSKKKVLLMDQKEEADYAFMPVVPVEWLTKWTSGNYRVITDWASIKNDATYITGKDRKGQPVMPGYNGITDCTWIIEDATSMFVNGKVDENLRKLITTNRHVNVDVYMIFHSWAETPPGILRNANYVIIKKTNDSPQELRKLSKIPGGKEVKKEIEKINRSRNEYATKLLPLKAT